MTKQNIRDGTEPESHAATNRRVEPSHLTSVTPQSRRAPVLRSLITVSLVQLLKYESSPVQRRLVSRDAPTIKAPSATMNNSCHSSEASQLSKSTFITSYWLC